MLRPLFSNRGTSNSSSSFEIALLKAGWVTESKLDADVKFSVSAIVLKY